MDKQVYEFIAEQSGEKIVERRKCKCGEEFAITNKDMEFYDKISPIFGGQKYSIPAPTLCPECRQQRRLAWRNERKLYKRKCDLTGKPIISIYSPDSEYTIYEAKQRRSDNRNPMDYGKEFDFSKTFFEQFDELLKKVPRIALNGGNDNENSDYNNYVGNSKNCYMNFGIDNSLNTLYSSQSSSIKDSYEVSNSVNIENCGYLERSGNSSNSFFLDGSIFVRNGLWVKWSKDIDNGIFCLNIANKKYVYKNKEIGKEEFEKIYKEIKKKLKTYSGMQSMIAEFDEYLKGFPVLASEMTNNENCFGVLITDSQNCSFGYSLVDAQNCKYCTDSSQIADCMDINVVGNGANHILEGLNCFGCSDVYFSEAVFENSRNVFYSSNCANNCSNLFGCVGLTNKQYCILNKQYTKEEYEELVPQIIEYMKKSGQRGEFFAENISPFGYNETIANDYFPLDRETALNKGFKWQEKEYPINVPDGIEKIKAQDLPDNIDDIDDEILKKAIICEVSSKPFRIVPMELEFCRKHGLPLPHKHLDVRFAEKIMKLQSRKLYLRTCDNCGKQVISIYPPNSKYRVFCTECYDKEIS